MSRRPTENAIEREDSSAGSGGATNGAIEIKARDTRPPMLSP
jgi:hypothetical protein